MGIEHNKRLIIVILVLLSVITALNYGSSHKRDQLDNMTSVFINALDLAINADRDLYQAHTAGQKYLMTVTTDPMNAGQELSHFEQNAEQALERMRMASKLLLHDAQITQQMALLESDYTVWINSARHMFKMAKTGKFEQARNFNNGLLQQHFIMLRAHYDKIGELARGLADTANI